jgi:hypothetical protein
LNDISVWIENTAWWGTPVIEVLTNGSWYQDTAMSQFLPTTGWVVLPFNTILQFDSYQNLKI